MVDPRKSSPRADVFRRRHGRRSCKTTTIVKEEPNTEKLHKVMARAGLGSRRACEEMVAAGRVRVDGVVATVADRVGPQARITVDGRPLGGAPRLVHVALHKPPGYITTWRDPQGRPTVRDLVADVGLRLFPVGRLDGDAEGLLILTNDGPLAHALTHPSFGVPRVYEVTVRGVPSERALHALRSGVPLEDGMTAPAEVALLRSAADSAVIRMEMHEGRNRQIKRMCEWTGHRVLRLKRVRVGPLTLGRLPLGRWRLLTEAEVERLRRAAGMFTKSSRPGNGHA
jgi:pseudouridine synthase